MSPGLRRKLLRRNHELKEVIAEVYQVVGVLADDAGRFFDDDVQKVLDNLAAMKPVHKDVLPFESRVEL